MAAVSRLRAPPPLPGAHHPPTSPDLSTLGAGGMRQRALLGLALLALWAAGGAVARNSGRAWRQLADAVLPKPAVCDMSDSQFQDAFAALEAACPRAAPFSCGAGCWAAMDVVRGSGGSAW